MLVRIWSVRPFTPEGGKPRAFVRFSTPKAFIDEGSNETEFFHNGIVYQENLITYLTKVFGGDKNPNIGLPMDLNGRWNQYTKSADKSSTKQKVVITAEQLKSWGFGIADTNAKEKIQLEFPVPEVVNEYVIDSARRIPGVKYTKQENGVTTVSADADAVAVTVSAVEDVVETDIDPATAISDNDLPF